MNTLITLTVVACFAAYVQACCTPDQWEGGEGGMSGYASKWRGKGGSGEFAKVSYDYTNKRTFANMTSWAKGKVYNFHILTLHGKDGEDGGKKYVLDTKTGKCWTKKAFKPMRQACTPENEKGYAYTLGLKDGGLNVESYQVHKHGIFGSISVAPIANTTLCVPVGETLQGRVKRVDFMAVVGFMDITPGIKDESVFDIPAACKEEESEVSLEMELERDHFFMAV